MTLIEVMLALSILVFAALAFSQALVSASRSTTTTREMSIAEQAARQVVETMQAVDFDKIFASYDHDPANDPGGVPGSAPGASFVVEGLDVLPGDADGVVGEVLLPETAPGVLGENFQQPRLSMPRDLNADGVVDALDHSGDYRLLPVLVRVAWRGSNGPAEVEIKTILADY
jgi:type II secretory pathway pseudopilin PulG